MTAMAVSRSSRLQSALAGAPLLVRTCTPRINSAGGAALLLLILAIGGGFWWHAAARRPPDLVVSWALAAPAEQRCAGAWRPCRARCSRNAQETGQGSCRPRLARWTDRRARHRRCDKASRAGWQVYQDLMRATVTTGRSA
ncbi:hypothetical protein ACU4GD_15600 [Cupriavidus basilensis]